VALQDALTPCCFSLAGVVIFSFSFDPLAEESRRIAGGLCGGIFVSRRGRSEPDLGGANCAIKCSMRPSFSSPANALFMAKATGQLFFRQLLEGLMTPCSSFLQSAALGRPGKTDSIALLGNVGAGRKWTFFARLAAHPQPELMLPLLLFLSQFRLCSEWLRVPRDSTGENPHTSGSCCCLTYDVGVYYCLSGIV